MKQIEAKKIYNTGLSSTDNLKTFLKKMCVLSLKKSTDNNFNVKERIIKKELKKNVHLFMQKKINTT